MRYQEAEQARQTILNLLNGDPTKGSTVDMVAAGINRNRVESSVRMMVRLKELEKSGKGRMTRYKALVKITRTALEMHEMVVKAQVDANIQTKQPEPKVAPWLYQHTPCDHPIPNQEGIGSGRSRVYVCASAGML